MRCIYRWGQTAQKYTAYKLLERSPALIVLGLSIRTNWETRSHRGSAVCHHKQYHPRNLTNPPAPLSNTVLSCPIRVPGSYGIIWLQMSPVSDTWHESVAIGPLIGSLLLHVLQPNPCWVEVFLRMQLYKLSSHVGLLHSRQQPGHPRGQGTPYERLPTSLVLAILWLIKAATNIRF